MERDIKEGEGCDYCERKAVGWVTYEGLHRVCEKHRQIIFELAEKGLLGIDFQRELEERGGIE
jgi:hypothetical protein